MKNIDEVLATLRVDAAKITQLENERLELLTLPLNPADKDEREQELRTQIAKQLEFAKKVLRGIVEFPPHHTRHSPLLQQFHGDAPFAKSVFVMTKFPRLNGTAADQQLAAVITSVREAVDARGYVARVASDKDYHPMLWDNVELYLLGCQRGIAIVEDKYQPELNPNVAMEWGWMRGMGRNVLYLVERSFQHHRADWSGLIQETFDWANPDADIKAAVARWLK